MLPANWCLGEGFVSCLCEEISISHDEHDEKKKDRDLYHKKKKRGPLRDWKEHREREREREKWCMMYYN